MKNLHTIIIATLVLAIAATASFRSPFVAARVEAAHAQNAPATLETLGNYPDTSVQLGANAIITPDAAPAGATTTTVSTSTNFKGELEADATTGVVRIRNAHPALPLPTDFYTVTVTAFDNLNATTTTTFKLTVTTPAACNPVSFAAANNIATGDTPLSVAVGDFNRDGKQDLVTANQGPDNLSILTGDGAGSFTVVTSGGHCRNRIETFADDVLATARSSWPSPLKSPTARPSGFWSTLKLVAALKLPAPSPNNTEISAAPVLAAAMSCVPSPLKSPTD